MALKNCKMFDPIDNLSLVNKVDEVFESPNFLLTKEDYGVYRKKTEKYLFNAFYMWGKKIVDIIPNVFGEK